MLSYKLDKDFEFIAVQKVFICAAERLYFQSKHLRNTNIHENH